MNTGKFLRRWTPVVVAVLPLAFNIVRNLPGSIGSTPPPPSVGAPDMWKLIASGQKVMAEHSWLVSVTLGAFLFTLTNLVWRSEEILKAVVEVPHSNVTWIAGAHKVFDHLTQRIRHAESRIYLMYLRSNPAYDDATVEYWARTTKLFLKKTVGNLPIRRIASFDERGKLDHLLKNNSLLFTEGGSAVRQIEYELRAFPFHKVRPLRIDVIDDAAFMFKTFGTQIMVTDKDFVEECAKYYDGLWKDLEGWTIMDMCRAEKLKPAEGRTEYGYSEAQLVVIARVIVDVMKDKPSEKTFAFIEPHCEISWEDFKKLCEQSTNSARMSA